MQAWHKLPSHQKDFGDHGAVAGSSHVWITSPPQAQFTAGSGGTRYFELHHRK
jgi:hypothetical protein